MQVLVSSFGVKPTKVYDTYWRFAAERQEIFFRRLLGAPPPWTDDAILRQHKFTNAYRASDRVSQYLIKNVLYRGDQTPGELFFRCFLFKVFNRVDTWEMLQRNFGEIRYSTYSFKAYDQILEQAKRNGKRIFSAAYIMPSRTAELNNSSKHRNYLLLLEKMMADGVPVRLREMKSMGRAFELLRSYPLMGNFLAYQFVTDINYSSLTDFSEGEFVVPGPGARDGMRKCFESIGNVSEADVIRLVASKQQDEFDRLGVNFRSLWGRPLQLIDCQNLFCELDKYARVAHPDVPGISGRTRIKQKFTPNSQVIHYWFPPKWGLNGPVEETLANRISTELWDPLSQGSGQQMAFANL